MSYPLSYNLIIFVTGSIFIYQRLLFAFFCIDVFLHAQR